MAMSSEVVRPGKGKLKSKLAKKPVSMLVGSTIVGESKRTPLEVVKPNGWNPNRMTPFMKKSLRQGLETDGWLASQALLVWGKDDKGKTRNVIIDGEHRYNAALELGFKEGPMVFLNGLNEAQAKSLTVKMNQKRGEFVEDDLAVLIKGIQEDLGGDNLGLDLGLQDEELMKLLAFVPEEERLNITPDADKGNGFDLPGGKTSHVKMVQLYFTPTQHEEFHERVKKLALAYGTTDVTATVMEHLRHAAAAASK